MSSYYSPFAILTDSQKAPCVFELAVPLLGPLNNGNPVEQGTRVDLPLWLASILTSSEPAGPGNGYICLIELPASMGKKVINALRADPKSVELRQQAAFWFGMSEHMMILLEDEAVQEVIIDVSIETLLSTVVPPLISNHSHSSNARSKLQIRHRTADLCSKAVVGTNL